MIGECPHYLKFWTHHTQWCGDTSNISTFCPFLIMMVWNYFYNCFLHSNDTQILIISTILTILHFSFFGNLTAKFIIFNLYMSLHAKNALNTIVTNNLTVTISCQKIDFDFWITPSRDIITMSQLWSRLQISSEMSVFLLNGLHGDWYIWLTYKDLKMYQCYNNKKCI